MARKILVVDDDKGMIALAREWLGREGFEVVTAANGKEGLALARSEKPDLVVLDILMPEMDGYEVCRNLKREDQTRAIPILMLSGKGDVPDKVAGLELGADDYVSKPFSFPELIARIRAILRRLEARQAMTVTRCGTLAVDWARYEVSLEGKPVALSPKEFELLRILVEAGGRVLSRDHLLERVWGIDRTAEVETRTIDQHVSQLRKKLGKESERIRSVRDVGYSFEGEAEGESST